MFFHVTQLSIYLLKPLPFKICLNFKEFYKIVTIYMLTILMLKKAGVGRLPFRECEYEYQRSFNLIS